MTVTNLSILKLKKLQDYLKQSNYNLNLPKLIFIGSQSSGKSSVLERIILRDILPKGSEITTRCPIEINLRKTTFDYEYVEISDISFRSFSKAKAQIIREMNTICGENKCISNKSIVVNMYLDNCVELCLVDLPGLTKFPLDGQPKDIEHQLLEITMKYIEENNNIILPIVPANVDISTVEVLKICKKVDPNGKRTLGIITKIDLMDEGTDCVDILNNKINTLYLGYIGIINRGQSDLNNNFQLTNLIQKENSFFKNHKMYKNIKQVGGNHLIEKLNDYFIKLVESEIPKIRAISFENIKKIEKELNLYENVYVDKNYLLNEFTKTLKAVIKEKFIIENSVFSYESDKNIHVEFKEYFNIKTENFVLLDNIVNEIKNSNSIFLSETIFKKIVFARIEELRKKILLSFENVFGLINNHLDKIESQRFKKLNMKIVEIIKQKIVAQHEKLIHDYNHFLKIQTSLTNINHPDFCKKRILKKVLTNYINSKKSIKYDNKLFQFFNLKEEKIEIDDNFDIDLVYNFSDAYFECNKKFLIDHAIKSCYFYFFEYLKHIDLKTENFEENCFEEEKDALYKKEKLKREKEINEIIINILNE